MILYHFDVWAVVQFALAFVFPLLVGLVTTKVTSSRDQFLVLATLTLVSTIVTSALTAHDAHTTFDVMQAILTAAGAFIVSVATHFGMWKPTGLSDAVLGVGRTAPAALAAVLPFPGPTAPGGATAAVPAPAPVVPAPAAPETASAA